MKYRTLDEIVPEAKVVRADPASKRDWRRQRLEHLAMVLDAYEGPLQLMTRVEFLPKGEREFVRVDYSPLWVAYQDPVLRQQGLAGDRIGDAIAFFDLSWREAHHLFCDCHYSAGVTSRIIADLVRFSAHRITLHDLWTGFRTALRSWFRQATPAATG